MQKSNLSLATRFINHARNLTTRDFGESEYTKWLKYSDEALLAVPDDDRNFAWYGHVISRCPAYEIDPDLFKQAGDFRKKLMSKPDGFAKFKQTIINHPELMHAPFPVLWLEFNGTHREYENGISGKTIEKPSRNGALIFNMPNGNIRAYWFMGLTHEPMLAPLPGEMLYFEQTTKMQYILYPPHATADQRNTLQNFRIGTLQTLVFLKSRASLLKFEQVNEGPLAKKRRLQKMREGGFIPKSVGSLTYDVSRLLAKGIAQTKEEALALIRDQVIVMEHPKLRRVRKRDTFGNLLDGYEMRWITWSAHWRGGTEEQKAQRVGKSVIAPRKARAVAANPERELVNPYLQDTPADMQPSEVPVRPSPPSGGSRWFATARKRIFGNGDSSS